MSKCQPNTNLCVTQGDEKVYNLTFEKGTEALDITGATVVFTAKKMLSDETPIIEVIVTTHIDPTEGKTSIVLTPTITDIPTGTYYFDIQISSPDIQVKTVLKGQLEITWQVTE